MSGYIHVLKTLTSDPRFTRLARSLLKHTESPATKEFGETLALGCLVKLWLRADSHIRDDDTLELGPDEIDEFLGIDGVTKILEPNWAQILDPDHVKLPNYLAHNGIEARRTAQAAARQAKHRSKGSNGQALHDVTVMRDTESRSNVTSPSPPSPSPSQPLPNLKTKIPTAASPPAGFEEFQKVYPERNGDPGWRKAQRAWNARLTENYSAQDFIRGAERYAVYCLGTGKVGSEYVQQASTFLGPGKAFLLPWTLPPKAENASERILRKLREPEAIEHEPGEIPSFPRQ